MTFSEIRDLMLAYVIDQVDAQERALVETWLATGDPVAAAALAEARATLGELPLALDPVAPGEAMWGKLQAQLDTAATRPADTTPAGKVSGGGRSVAGVIGAALAAAAVAGLAAAVLTYWLVDQNFEAERQTLATLQQQVVDQERKVQTLTTRLEVAAERARFLQSPTRQVAELAGTEDMPGVAASLTWDDGLNRLSFAGAGFAPPTADQTYQLWFVTDPAGPVSLGVIDVDADGRVVYDAELPAFDATIQVVAVSLEPAGGSPTPGAPSGPVVAAGALK